MLGEGCDDVFEFFAGHFVAIIVQADTCTVKGKGLFDFYVRLVIIVQYVECGRQVAAQAVSGYAHFFSVADNFGFFKGLNPFFHIGNLPECPAFVFNF